MPLYLRSIMISILYFLASCSSTLPEARSWLDGKSGKTEIKISGHWICPKFGIMRLEQDGNKITGVSMDYNIEGIINESNIYLILYKDNTRLDFSLALQSNFENQLYGRCHYNIITDSKMGDSINIMKISLQKTMNEQWYINYYKTRKPFNTLTNGKRWLKIMEGDSNINIAGLWRNTEWDDANFIQEKNTIQGTLGVYQISGVINDNLIFMLILYKNNVYYTAIIDGKNEKYLKGKYYHCIAYSAGNEGLPIIFIK